MFVIVFQGEMIGKGTFQELSRSGIDFSSLLKHDDEEEEAPSNPGIPHSVQRSVSHDPHMKSQDHQLRLNPLHSKSYEHVNGHMASELRHRARVDSSCSRHSVHDSAAGSMLSLASIGTNFEVRHAHLI